MPTYTVICDRKIFGVDPGGDVVIDDEADAARLVAGGHVKLKGSRKPPSETNEEGI